MRLPLYCRSGLIALLSIIIPSRRSQDCVERLTLDLLRGIARREQIRAYAGEIRALLPYQNTAVRALVLEMKYRQNARAFALAAALLREELLGICEEMLGVPLLVPVPMHAARRRERGYNQTELLCQEIMGAFNPALQYAPYALMRIRPGTPQQKLPRAPRLINMKNTMRADRELVRERICIVLDDVSTTGATLLECRRALKKAGAKSVHSIALAG